MFFTSVPVTGGHQQTLVQALVGLRWYSRIVPSLLRSASAPLIAVYWRASTGEQARMLTKRSLIAQIITSMLTAVAGSMQQWRSCFFAQRDAGWCNSPHPSACTSHPSRAQTGCRLPCLLPAAASHHVQPEEHCNGTTRTLHMPVRHPCHLQRQNSTQPTWRVCRSHRQDSLVHRKAAMEVRQQVTHGASSPAHCRQGQLADLLTCDSLTSSRPACGDS